MNPIDNIWNAMELIATGDTDTALGILWRVQGHLQRAEREALGVMSMDEVNASIRDSIRKIADTREAVDKEMSTYPGQKLPAMKPINGKPKRIAPNSVIGVSCPRCGAKPHQPCFGMTMPGRHAQVDTSKTIATFHQARQDKARKKA